MQDQTEQIKQIIESAQKIVVIQADNPDADSLGSALALEQILGDLGKNVYLYCGVDIPAYLRYMNGWDRVNKDLASSFDASIIVDASTMTLLEKLQASGEASWLAAKPCVVLDHHAVVENKVYFASATLNDSNMSSAGELIYHLAKKLGWPLNVAAQEFIMSSILGDTQGLTNQLASASTYKVMAEMIEAGVSRPKLEEMRRELSKMPLEIYKYKADLIKRTEFDESGRVALVVVPDEEIKTYSPLYNPGPLIQTDMLQVEKVEVAIVIKSYNNGKVTGAIRSNPGSPIAAKLADHFGGGGHANASGFKIEKNGDASRISEEIKRLAPAMLDELPHADT
jgi:phosphoesterase RecJ-like protein